MIDRNFIRHGLKHEIWLAGFLICGFLAGFYFYSVQAAVSLIYFQAVPDNQRIKLQWATATEMNNAGFFVQRSLTRDSGYVRLNTVIIPAKGDGLTGSTYEYPDNTVSGGTQYWYRLESIDTFQTSQFSDPISATISSSPTAGPTSTATATPTPTSTTLSITPSPTATNENLAIVQFTPTQNLANNPLITPSPLSPYPGPGRLQETPGGSGPVGLPPTQAPSDLLQGTTLPGETTGLGGPTATFAPFPTVTIVFPVKEVTSAPIPELIDPTDWLFSRSGLMRLWPLGLLVIAWVVIGIWFYFNHRHFH